MWTGYARGKIKWLEEESKVTTCPLSSHAVAAKHKLLIETKICV